MFWFSIILFFAISISLGYSVTFFVKKSDNFLERLLMNIGFGLGVFALLTVILNLIRIQLHWMVFLSISLVIPLYSLYRKVSKNRLDFKVPGQISKSTIYILIVVIIFLGVFSVFYKGAFTYPFLEDDDPWFHAEVVKYVSNYRTFSHDPDVHMGYMEPYPPTYAVLMGVLHQTNTEVIWTLKFFNALIISLSVIFFYFFANEFFQSRRKALFSTFIMAVIPCFLGHFIWASTLAITLFFPALYAAERIRSDKKWLFVTGIMISGVLLSQPSNGGIFGIIFVIYWLSKVVAGRSFNKNIFFAGCLGIILAFSFFYIPVILKYGVMGALNGMGLDLGNVLQQSHAHSGGGLLYTWNDFFVAKTVSKMDNPIGLGIVLSLLLIFSFVWVVYRLFRKPKHIFSSANFTYMFMIAFLLFAFAGIHGNRLPVQLMPHRFWAIFAIPVALMCAEGFFALGQISKRINMPRFLIYSLIIIGILVTSAYPKYVVQTSNWPPGVFWGSMDEVVGYIQFVKPLPQDTKVFTMCSKDFKVLAYDKWAEPWDADYLAFKKSAINSSAEDIHSWLKSRGYEYMVIDSYCVNIYGANQSNEILKEIGTHSGFGVAGSNKGMYLLRVL